MPDQDILLEMTSDIVTAMLSNNSVPSEQLPSLITSVYSALSGLGQNAPVAAEDEKPTPAVSVRRSLADPNALISMIDGKPYSSLKRHITGHGYTPESYRDAFGLKADYPMIAPGYSERRRDIAMKLGLGRKAAAAEVAPDVAEPEAEIEAAPQKKTRKPRKLKVVPASTGE